MSEISPFVIAVMQFDEEIQDEYDAYPKLERHIAFVLQKINPVECVDRYPYNKQDRQNKNYEVHRILDKRSWP